MSDEINLALSPDDPNAFKNQHGTFLGVIVLVLLTAPMPIVQYIQLKNYASEYQIHLSGVILTIVGLILGGLSIDYSLLWLFYLGCSIPCGIGLVSIFSRIIFHHQLWFHKIGKKNLGAGLIGFFIGLWTIFYFVISVPLLDYFFVSDIFYLYAGFTLLFGLWPLLSIKDEDLNSNVSSINILNSSKSNESLPDSVSIKLPEDDVMVYDEVPQESFREVSAPSTEHESDAYALSNIEILSISQTWIMIGFQSALLTPGWGIKLASFTILINLFKLSRAYAAIISSAYISCYALGRLFSGGLAEIIGTQRTYDFIMLMTIICLLLLPIALNLLPHDAPNSSGVVFFSVVICVIGLLYGGGQALLYSIVFDIFGAVNYKSVFSVTSSGFSVAVIVGGLSSSYSFSGAETGDAATLLAQTWFYTMAGSAALGWILIRILKPYDYSVRPRQQFTSDTRSDHQGQAVKSI